MMTLLCPTKTSKIVDCWRPVMYDGLWDIFLPFSARNVQLELFNQWNNLMQFFLFWLFVCLFVFEGWEMKKWGFLLI